MTRQEIENEYNLEHGCIINPGKFEGEMLYVPYFYDAIMNGYGDFDDWMVLGNEEFDMFPELIGYTQIRLSQSDSDFVSCQLRNK